MRGAPDTAHSLGDINAAIRDNHVGGRQEPDAKLATGKRSPGHFLKDSAKVLAV